MTRDSREPRNADRAQASPDTTRVPQTPPIARPEAPEGPDVTAKPEASPGHYGPGYGDPTRHMGDAPPGRDTERPGADTAGEPGSVARTDATGGNAGRGEGTGVADNVERPARKPGTQKP